MPNSSNPPQKSITASEARLIAEAKIAVLKTEIDKYQSGVKGSSGSSVFVTEKRLKAASKIAELRNEIDRYQQQPENPMIEPGNHSVGNKTSAVSAAKSSVAQIDALNSSTGNDAQKSTSPIKVRWAVRQATRLLAIFR